METKTKFIPRKKESVEKVKIKPPTQKVNKHKLSFEIRVQIDNLCKTLPDVPFFMMGNDGKAKIQQQSRGKLISFADLPEDIQASKRELDEIAYKKNYRQQTKIIRNMNHKVTLNQQYQSLGQKGIDDYVGYVADLHNSLMALSERLNNPKEKPTI